MKLNRYFSFEAKFGWSEVLSLLALVFALWAFIDQRTGDRPTISLANFPIAVGQVRDTRSGRDVFATVIPLIFTNAGNRSTSLVTFRRNELVEPALFIIDGRARPEPGKSEFFVLTRMIETKQEWEAFLPLLKAFDPAKDPPILNLTVPAGESRAVYVGVVADIYGRGAEQLLVALEAEFSDGRTQPIRAAVQIPKKTDKQ